MQKDYFLTSTIAKEVIKVEGQQVNLGQGEQEKEPGIWEKETGQEAPEFRRKAGPNKPNI